jgi:glucose-6-phosphate isomerase
MDQHWLNADPLQNIPWQLGLLDVWNRNALHYHSRCVVPYDFRLSRLPAYLQQLEMESNGKGVDQRGRILSYHSSALVWGESGTNAQHSFFQWLHQGTDATPVEFVLISKPDHHNVDAHRQLLSNALAQSLALIRGKSLEEALNERPKSANPTWTKEQVAAHRVFPGGRPSTIISLEKLDAHSLGALIALYEHRVAVAGFLWRVNSFDQWGVELGKELAVDIEAHMSLRRVHPDTQTDRWIQLFASQSK